MIGISGFYIHFVHRIQKPLAISEKSQEVYVIKTNKRASLVVKNVLMLVYNGLNNEPGRIIKGLFGFLVILKLIVVAPVPSGMLGLQLDELSRSIGCKDTEKIISAPLKFDGNRKNALPPWTSSRRLANSYN